MCQELLGNATVVDDAIKFVSDRSKDKPKLRGNSNESYKEESNEADYGEDQDQLEENKKRRLVK
jgi:hypothetical protein